MSFLSGHELLVYCPYSDSSVRTGLGEPDYSYYFVMKHFLPLLQTFAPVTVVSELGDLDEVCVKIRAQSKNPLALIFAPPHQMPASVACDVIPVFAWEFDEIPDGGWATDPKHDWSAVLTRLPGAITHSSYSIDAVQRALGTTYPIVSLPSPVWDDYAGLANKPWTGESRTLCFHGTCLDSSALGLDTDPTFDSVAFETGDQTLLLSGVVFTSVANPTDGRKNWLDQLTAFVWTFREVASVTLVFKLVHHDRDRVCAAVLLELRKLAPFRCRVVVIHGYLEPGVYEQLIEATTYALNSSHGEGQCLPMMEFMSAGRPAVAPTHTAFAQYVNNDNAMTVRSSLERTFWPQDPRRRLTCMRYRLDWDSLCEAFASAAHVAEHDRGRYLSMSSQATLTLERHCAKRIVAERFEQFFRRLGYARTNEIS